MKSVVTRLEIDTTRDTELIDITERVRGVVQSAGVGEGVAYITTTHTTTAITVNEGLPDVEADIIGMLDRLAPSDGPYLHARFLPSDGTMAVNSAAHQRAAILGPQVAFPVQAGHLSLGGRQTIYFAELDGPLRRTFVVHVLGE